jgi:hypothetical protein
VRHWPGLCGALWVVVRGGLGWSALRDIATALSWSGALGESVGAWFGVRCVWAPNGAARGWRHHGSPPRFHALAPRTRVAQSVTRLRRIRDEPQSLRWSPRRWRETRVYRGFHAFGGVTAQDSGTDRPGRPRRETDGTLTLNVHVRVPSAIPTHPESPPPTPRRTTPHAGTTGPAHSPGCDRVHRRHETRHIRGFRVVGANRTSRARAKADDTPTPTPPTPLTPLDADRPRNAPRPPSARNAQADAPPRRSPQTRPAPRPAPHDISLGRSATRPVVGRGAGDRERGLPVSRKAERARRVVDVIDVSQLCNDSAQLTTSVHPVG